MERVGRYSEPWMEYRQSKDSFTAIGVQKIKRWSLRVINHLYSRSLFLNNSKNSLRACACGDFRWNQHVMQSHIALSLLHVTMQLPRIQYDAIYLRALKIWRKGLLTLLNLAHGTENEKIRKTKNKNRVAKNKIRMSYMPINRPPMYTLLKVSSVSSSPWIASKGGVISKTIS